MSEPMFLRSLLFLPANRLERLGKALASGTDLVVLDLEDGVGPDAKPAARRALDDIARSEMTAHVGWIAVCINPLASADGIRDLAMMLDWDVWPAMLVVPKVEAAAEVRHVVALVSSGPSAPALLLTLETAAGTAAAVDIAAAAPQGSVLRYGAADHMAETGGAMTPASLAFGRGQAFNAAATRRLAAVDGVWLDFCDPEGLTAEAELVRSMGFTGKIAIHPDQIAPIHRVFTPTPAEIADANALLDAAASAGGGAFAFNGRMVDAPVLTRARRIVDTMERGGEA